MRKENQQSDCVGYISSQVPKCVRWLPSGVLPPFVLQQKIEPQIYNVI